MPVHLSIIQARFSRQCQMTEFNRFQGLQSEIKQLSIYTVVLLGSNSNVRRAVCGRTTRHQGGITREFAEHQHKERGYYGR
jgi:hypothetical protein